MRLLCDQHFADGLVAVTVKPRYEVRSSDSRHRPVRRGATFKGEPVRSQFPGANFSCHVSKQTSIRVAYCVLLRLTVQSQFNEAEVSGVGCLFVCVNHH